MQQCKQYAIKMAKWIFCVSVSMTSAEHPVGILPGTELLDSQVRTEFSTGSFQMVFFWLSTEFSSGYGLPAEIKMSTQRSRGRLPMQQSSQLLNLNCLLYN